MLEVYNNNIAVDVDSFIPFNSLHIEKGCTARLMSPNTIALEKAGIYMITCSATAEDATTIQLYKNGIAEPQTLSTGTTPGFTTFIQVDKNNTICCCSSPVTLQVENSVATTFTTIDVCVSKLC